MATFKQESTGKRFYFVHIPRTAGRFIETNLMVNNDLRGMMMRSLKSIHIKSMMEWRIWALS